MSPHGGRVERRRLAASTALVGHGDWPSLQQVLRLERRVVAKATGAVPRQETAYAVTSLAPAEASPAQLLALWRAHWAIEIVQAQDAAGEPRLSAPVLDGWASEGGKRGPPGPRSRCPREPGGRALEVERRADQQVVEFRLRQPDISGAS